MAQKVLITGTSPLTNAEVAAAFRAAGFRAGPAEPGRWARDGKLPEDFRTIGGHRRWHPETIRAALLRATEGWPT